MEESKDTYIRLTVSTILDLDSCITHLYIRLTSNIEKLQKWISEYRKHNNKKSSPEIILDDEKYSIAEVDVLIKYGNYNSYQTKISHKKSEIEIDDIPDSFDEIEAYNIIEMYS
jgi:hypothetical protein